MGYLQLAQQKEDVGTISITLNQHAFDVFGKGIIPVTRSRMLGNLLWRANTNDLAALTTAFRTEVNNPIHCFDHIKITFQNHHGITPPRKPDSTFNNCSIS
ncbi:hypothetical protein TNCV_2907021 [Trichonephila clavipes]|nr:hypothetical protein TNCV_2907021 [Trichonephila clavipes]